VVVVVDTVYLSYQIWPVGQPPQGLGMHVPLSLASQAARLFAWALLLAGPVVLVLFVLLQRFILPSARGDSVKG
jgi:type III secretory pathway component EscT